MRMYVYTTSNRTVQTHHLLDTFTDINSSPQNTSVLFQARYVRVEVMFAARLFRGCLCTDVRFATTPVRFTTLPGECTGRNVIARSKGIVHWSCAPLYTIQVNFTVSPGHACVSFEDSFT